MAIKIILMDDNGNQEKILMDEIQDKDWEENCYQLGCKVARAVANRYLEQKEKQILKERPSGLRVKDIRERMLVTRFGEITVRRRRYQDEQGAYHFLLDEHLNWRSHQSATPSLTEALVDSATGSTFRRVSRELEKYTAGVLSASTVHGLLQRVSQNAIDREKADWRSCFESGILSWSGGSKIPVLYTEADGLWVHLQQ
jgi:hypothetical protein